MVCRAFKERYRPLVVVQISIYCPYYPSLPGFIAPIAQSALKDSPSYVFIQSKYVCYIHPSLATDIMIKLLTYNGLKGKAYISKSVFHHLDVCVV